MLSAVSRFAAVSGICVSMLFGAAQVQAESVTISHSSGQTEVPVQPQKAVVLDWSTLDTLAQLGVTVAGIPSGNPPEVLETVPEASSSVPVRCSSRIWKCSRAPSLI